MTPIRALLAAVATLAIASPAMAGDPCPIDYTFHDLGAPEWLDRDALLDALTSKDSWVGMSFGNTKGGVVVRAVSPESPAAAAGLAKDQVITHANGTAMPDHQTLGSLFRTTAPGATLKLTLADKTEKTLVLGRQDPLIGKLIDHAAAQECAEVRRAPLTAEQVKTLRAKVFEKNRRFKCDDAHDALAKDLQGGDIVIVRGSKRLLLSSPGWGTVCIRAKNYDGDKLTDAAIETLFQKVAGKYTADRHANP